MPLASSYPLMLRAGDRRHHPAGRPPSGRPRGHTAAAAAVAAPHLGLVELPAACGRAVLAALLGGPPPAQAQAAETDGAVASSRLPAVAVSAGRPGSYVDERAAAALELPFSYTRPVCPIIAAAGPGAGIIWRS